MKGITTFGAVCAIASTAVATPSSAPVEKRTSITPVTVSGNAFWAGTERFYVRGVDYQPGGASDPVDPIANPTTCKRDVPMFKELGINTVRVYTVDNTKNHDECMSALAEAGIYLALDVNSGLYSINRDDPAPSYNAVYLQSVFATIDSFSSYPNTLLFFSGNEVINAPNNTNTAPYIKAVTRDMKNYIKARSPRQIPVGYSAADVTQNRLQTAEYMNCGSDGMARSDFFAFNDYSYCNSNFQESGWATKVQTYSSYPLPIFLSEYGCNTNLPRDFTEVQALYNKEMTGVYSGGLVYEYTEELDPPNFGLVKVTGNTVKKLPDFTTLQKQLAANPAPAGSGGARSGTSVSSCPPFNHNWQVKGEGLPAMPVAAQKYMTNGAGTGPGLNGPGSQNAGSGGSHFITATAAGVTETAASPSNIGSGSGNGAGSLNQGGYAPLVCAMIVVVSSILGASIL